MSMVDGAGVSIHVLGPVEARRGDEALRIGGPRQRTLLALLAVRPGQWVSSDVLIEELFRGEPSEAADVTLRSYVSKLRAALGEGLAVRGGAAGYLLDARPESIDAGRFQSLIAEGDAALARRRPRRAADRLHAALALWRGDPFTGLTADGVLGVEAERLRELRLHAVEARLEAELALGRSGELVDELEKVLSEHPYREGFWRQLMLALYRSERQADALAAFHRARTALDEELGIEPGPELVALEAAILRQDVPAANLPVDRHNLPAPLTPFVGRADELAEVDRVLRTERLVVLTGVGGTGKTRLAIETAWRRLDEHPDGVWFVDLAAVADPAHVAGRVAETLRVVAEPGRSVLDAIGTSLRDAELLLVLDNCEHVREAAAETAASLISAARAIRVLATSRETLGVAGEFDLQVPPLGIPAESDDTDAIRASEAVVMFLARARAAGHTAAEDDAAVAVAARICRDLDGLPLALELAAARARALALEDIAARLDDRFRFLAAWRRLSPARHRTLQEAMDWSYDLLAADERELLARLSVFAGSFSLEAVAAVCVDDPDQALEQLGRLVDASLVVVVEIAGHARYRLLETVRQYAAAHLQASHEVDALRRRHAEEVLRIAQSCNLSVEAQAAGTPSDIERLRRDEGNVVAALDWTLEHDPILGLEIQVATEEFWAAINPLDGMRRTEALLARARDVPPALRARVLRQLGGSAMIAGFPDIALERHRESLRLFESIGDEDGALHLLFRLASAAVFSESVADARRMIAEGLERAAAPEHRWYRADFLDAASHLAAREGDAARALELVSESLAIYRERGGWPWGEAVKGSNQAWYAHLLGREDEAASYGREALRSSLRIADPRSTVYAMATLVVIARSAGDDVRAGRLWGWVEAKEGRASLGTWHQDRNEFAEVVLRDPTEALEEGRRWGRAAGDLGPAYALDTAVAPPDIPATSPR